MNRKIWIPLVTIAGLVVFLVAWSPAAAADVKVAAGELFKVRRGDLAIALTENGTLVARDSKKVSTEVEREAKITFLVEEGKSVAEGDVVCRLDATALQRQVSETELEILQTEANLKTARTEREIQQVENAANLGKAEVALKKAQQELEKYKDGEAPQERRKLEVAIKDTDTEFTKAEKNLADSKKLLDLNYIKKSELEEHQIAFERATVQKEGNELALRIFDKYSFPMMMTDLQTKLADATRELDTAKKRGESQLGQKEVAVQQLEKRLTLQKQQVEEQKKDLDHMTLKAPCPGMVVYGDPHQPWYRENVKVGGTVYGDHTVLTIPDLRVMQVKIQIHEADINKIKVDLPATVTTDTYANLLLRGKVTKIAAVANSRDEWGGGNSDVKKFGVEITLDTDVTLQLKPGISAKAEIQIETRAQVLHIPLQSVFTETGEHFCHVLDANGAPTRRKVEIGPSNDNYLEITSGLAEGEQVLLYNPTLPAAGAGKDGKKPAPGKGDDAGKDGGAATGTPVEASHRPGS